MGPRGTPPMLNVFSPNGTGGPPGMGPRGTPPMLNVFSVKPDVPIVCICFIQNYRFLSDFIDLMRIRL